jgi:cytochrome c oxidase cbb3-type subunit 3/ubiquinol-cytochrome c reductase cytochrome c subunit
MKTRSLILCAVTAVAVLATAGCRNAPGKPGSEPEIPRPEQVVDFPTLYAENCAACHGVHGQNGAAISLANPVYIAIAGAANIQHITAVGVVHTAMPPFAQSSGGMLTDQQIAILAQGIATTWGKPASFAGVTIPAYASTTPGDATRGQLAFTNLCARCHGANATGGKADNGSATGSLVDPAYLALISDQGLRSTILAGQTEKGPHDWRSYTPVHPMTDQDVADVVAWLTSHRVANPGQPYQSH